jgi:predicted phosphodiesterase
VNGASPFSRTAIISDVHSNAVALRAVVAELESEGIDRVVCLGDVCQGGPEPGECVDLLAERGWPVVMGNADAFVLDPATAEGSSEVVTERQLAVREWTYDRLTSAQRDLLAAYAPTVEHDLGDNRTLLCCHATPNSYEPIVLPSAPEEEYRAAFGGSGADVVACGHIHLPYVRRLGTTMVLNPGSVGLGYDHEQDPEALRFDPWAAWAVIATGGGRLSIDLRRTPFDAREVADAHRASGMPYGDEYARSWAPA